MRVKVLGLGLVALTLAGCGKNHEAADGKVAATEPASAPAAPNAQPRRKAGLWEQTMTTAGRSLVTKVCTDEAFEQKANVLASNTLPGACKQTVTPTAGGWSFSSQCDLGSGGQSSSQGAVTGDMASRYEVKATTTVSGAAVPQMNRTSEVDMVAEYKGSCPQGWAPGDMEMPGLGHLKAAAAMSSAHAAAGQFPAPPK
jgi:hypothetical protein